MYKKAKRLISKKEEPGNYIDGFDVYDSYLLSMLSNPNLGRISYTIMTKEYRPDLIAQEVYGAITYMGLVMLQVAGTLSDLSQGSTIMLLPKELLDEILNSIV